MARLHLVCGIHIHLQGSQLSEEIKKWDVKILMVSLYLCSDSLERN
jgi:hypothetical protein